MPITTAGDRDRTKPFGQIGERGVFVKELEEALLDGPHRRRRALRQGHDLDRHRRARGRRLPAARGSARRALRRRRAAARDADRHGLGPAARAAARARAVALDRAAARQHRHAAAQARRARARRGRAGGVRARPARARGTRSGSASSRSSCCRRPVRARSRCRCERARRSSWRRPTTPRPAAASRPSAAAWRVIGGGCLAPVAAHHDGATLTALVADEDGAWIERRSGADPEAVAQRAARRPPVRVVVTRPLGQAGRARSPARGARPRGRRRARSSRSSRSATSRSTSTATTGSSSRASTARRSCGGACAGTPKRVAAIGPATAAAFGGADLVPAVSTQEGLLAELPRPGRPGALRGRGGRAPLLVDELGADFVPLYRTRELVPAGAAGRRPRRARVRLGGARLRARRERRSPAVSIGPRDDRRPRGRPASRWSRRRRRTIWTGSWPRSHGGGLTSAPCSSRS